MRKVRPGWALFAVMLLGSCAPRTAPPAPPPPAPPPSSPTPPPPPPPPWEDGEARPGDWTYNQVGGGSRAVFGAGAPLFMMECRADRRISLTRPGTAMFANSMRVLTSTGYHDVPAVVGPSGLTATLEAVHPMFDAIAFSRGRFAVESVDTTLLILPAWPELARVIEDCRG